MFNKNLSVNDIQTMSMSDIVDLYNNGYGLNNLSDIGIETLDVSVQKLDISTWLGETTCIGTAPSQVCFKNEYPIIAVGVIGLVLLLRK